MWDSDKLTPGTPDNIEISVILHWLKLIRIMSVFVDKMLREEKERVLKNGVKKNFIFLATMSRSMFIVLILFLYALIFFF